MRRRVGSLAIFACLIAVIAIAPGIRFGSGSKGAFAGAAVQQASPIPEAISDATMRLSDEIEVVLLGAMELGGLPTEGVAIRLERVTLKPGDTVKARSVGTELLVVESGDISVATANDLVTLMTGGQIVVPAGEPYEVSAGKSNAAVLRFALAGTNHNDDQASPVASRLTSPSAVRLISGERTRLDSRRGTLFIARVTLPPGAATGRQIFSGPVGLAVESGSLLVNTAASPRLVLEAGSNVLVPGFTAVDVANDGEAAAVLLVAGVLAPPTGNAVGPRASPMGSPTPSAENYATAQAEIDSLQNSLAALATSEASLSETVTAQQTAIASAEAAQASSEAELTRVASESADSVAIAEATSASLESEIAAGANALGTANAELANVESTLTAVSSGRATVQAAANSAATEAAATATAASAASSALQATVVALQTQNAGLTNNQATAQANATSAASTAAAAQSAAEATIAAQTTAIAAANATATSESETAASVIAAGESAMSSAEATIAAQTTQIAAANATATAESEAAASVIAVDESSLADAEATIGAQTTQIAASNATATAQAEAAASAEASSTLALSNAEATSAAYATAVAASEATASADAAAAASAFAEQSSAATAAAETASAENASADATIAAQSTFTNSVEETLATAVAQGVVSEATIVALSTAQAESSSIVVTSVNPRFVDVSVQVNLDGLIAGDQAAINEAENALDTALKPFDGCRAGVVLTFGHGNSIGEGTLLARAINAVIQDRYPEIFDGAAFDAFGDLSPPRGQVDVRIYFFTGCAAAEESTPGS